MSLEALTPGQERLLSSIPRYYKKSVKQYKTCFNSKKNAEIPIKELCMYFESENFTLKLKLQSHQYPECLKAFSFSENAA